MPAVLMQYTSASSGSKKAERNVPIASRSDVFSNSSTCIALEVHVLRGSHGQRYAPFRRHLTRRSERLPRSTRSAVGQLWERPFDTTVSSRQTNTRA